MNYQGIGLCRLSTEEQAAGGKAGLLRQREELRLTCERFGIEITEVFEIVDVSGAQIAASPEFQRLLVALSNPSIHGLVIAAIDRLMRPDDFTTYGILDFFLQNRKLIWIPSSQIDVAEDSGFMQATVHSMMAGLDRRRILKNTQMGKEQNRKRGRCANAKITLPRGVDFDFRTGRWSWVGPESSRVKDAIKLLLSGGRSVRSIAKELGYRTERTLYNQLRNPIWIGVREYRFKRGEKYPSKNGRQSDRRKILRDQPLRVPIDIEPVVSKEDFDRVQTILDGSRQHWMEARRSGSRFECSGVLYCGKCGERFYSKGERRDRYDHYHCRSQHKGGRGCGAVKPRREHLDYSVCVLVSEIFTKPQNLIALLSSVRREGDTENFASEIRSATERIRDLGFERQRLLTLSVKGLFTESEIERQARRIDAEMRAASVQLQRAESSVSAAEIEKSSEILGALCSVFTEFALLGRRERKRLLRAYLSKVEITEGRISKVVIRLPATNAKNCNHTGKDS